MSPIFKSLHQLIEHAKKSHVRTVKLKIRREDESALKADPDAPKYLQLKPNGKGDLSLYAFGVEVEFV